MPTHSIGLAMLWVATLAFAGVRATALQAQVRAAPDASMPATGMDFSAVDQFWKVADVLSKDSEPTEEQWRALLRTPGYRLAEVNLGPVMREAIDVALKPSRRGEYARLTQAGDERSLVLRHLARAAARRAELEAFRDSLAHSSLIADAVAIAARSLPRGATGHGAPPLVAVALFRDDGYSLPQGIVIDLLNVRGTDLARNLAHEFHHSYVNRLARPLPPGSDTAPDAGLRQALYDLRNEGLADLIDKPYPFSSPNPALAGYVARYNAEYARTPALLGRLDSLLAAVADEPARLADAGMGAQMLFWSNGHPNGAYVAREISETFGVDSLRVAALDPAAFLRIYASAERSHARPSPFSPRAWSVIDGLDARYWRPSGAGARP